MYKRTAITLFLFLFSWVPILSQQILPPRISSSTTFAIVVDQRSYEEAGSLLEQYRSSVERDGLGTYLIVHSWKSPEEIRKLLYRLYTDRRSPLEGCVLVGDIPIPMLRDAQHLTSAFKMNQARDWKESSVPSDRYYDDFDLQFDFIRQDSERPLYHYYSLRPESPYTLEPNIYSARIKPLESNEVDKYELLRRYLQKLVQVRSEGFRPLDNLSIGRGYGYNSEDPIPWANEQIALREQLPQAHRPGASVKYFEFDEYFPMRDYYLNEMQREDLDLLLLHHHGSPDTEYINGEPKATNIQENIQAIKRYIRSKAPRYFKKMSRDSTVIHFAQRFGVPRKWVEEALETKHAQEDSLLNAQMVITTTDLKRVAPRARFVILDACFNGSFHLPDYIAGAYLFNEGKTVAVEANTVNTLQDIWKTEMFGLLGTGLRLGHLLRMNCYLETHLFGDPTYHYANTSTYSEDVNALLSPAHTDLRIWHKLLASQEPDIQSLALRHMIRIPKVDAPALLEKSYFSSPHYCVRMEALKLLAERYPDRSVRVLKDALRDPYDLIRRFAIQYTIRIASPDLLSSYVQAYMDRSHEARTRLKLVSGVDAFDLQALRAEVEKQASERRLYDKAFVEKLLSAIDRKAKENEADFALFSDPTPKASIVKQRILAYRNHPAPKALPYLLSLLANTDAPGELRLSAAETLGWYDLSYKRHEIPGALRKVKTDDKDLERTIRKAIHRLRP